MKGKELCPRDENHLTWIAFYWISHQLREFSSRGKSSRLNIYEETRKLSCWVPCFCAERNLNKHLREKRIANCFSSLSSRNLYFIFLARYCSLISSIDGLFHSPFVCRLPLSALACRSWNLCSDIKISASCSSGRWSHAKHGLIFMGIDGYYVVCFNFRHHSPKKKYPNIKRRAVAVRELRLAITKDRERFDSEQNPI